MSQSSFDEETPLGFEIVAHRERDRYFAELVKSGAVALWSRLFGTRNSAQTAAHTLAHAYNDESGLAEMPHDHLMVQPHDNDPEHGLVGNRAA